MIMSEYQQNLTGCHACKYLDFFYISGQKNYFCHKKDTDYLDKFPTVKKLKCFEKIEPLSCWLCGGTKKEYVFIKKKRTAVDCSQCAQTPGVAKGD